MILSFCSNLLHTANPSHCLKFVLLSCKRQGTGIMFSRQGCSEKDWASEAIS